MKKLAFFIGMIMLAVFGHIVTQYHTTSLFLAPASIPLLIILIDPLPIIAVIGAFFVLDIYSTLPQGSMLFMFLIPFAMRWLWGNIFADLAWKFFFFVLSTITLQIAALAIISFGGAGSAFAAIPWGVLILQAAITSIMTFILAFIYHEYSS